MIKPRLIVAVLSFSVLAMLPVGCDNKGEAPAASKTTQPPAAVPVAPKVDVALPIDLSTLKAEAEKAKAQADLTIASLDATLAAADADPRPAFQKFQKDLEGLKAQASIVRTRGDAMKSKGQAYFKAWEAQLAQIATPEIKKAAETRRGEISKNYDEILSSMAATRESYDKLMAFMGDLSKVMENDLNAQGLKAVVPKVDQAKEQVKGVQAGVDGVIANLGKITSIYSPGK